MSVSPILAILAVFGPVPAAPVAPADPPAAAAPAAPGGADTLPEAGEAEAAPADAAPTGPLAEAPDASGAAEDQEKTLKAQFKNLRFEEDWTALADPEVQTDHWYPEIKYVELGEEGDWSASFGGQVRWQSKWDTNRSLTGSLPGTNSFHLLRTRLHGDLRLRDDFRAFVELLDARIHGNEAPATPIDRNNLDVLNAFAEFLGEDTSLRVGRTEMQYGAQRLISPLDWGNTRRTFQGGVFSVENGSATTDVFAVKPVIVDPRDSDDRDESRWLLGVYNTFALDGGTNIDAYLLKLDEDDPVTLAPSDAAGDLGLYTYGTRFWGKSGATDWEAELARQSGDYGSSSVRAEMVTVRGGHTFADCPGAPRVGLDLDYASGDEDPTDSTKGTFNQLYPLGHAYFGYMDLVGRQNIVQVMPNVVWKTSATTSFRVSYSDFELAESDDYLYNAGGGASSPTGALGGSKDVGHEVDLTLGWRPAYTAPHAEWLFGYSEFDPGTFVEGYGDGERARLVYVQYTYTF